MLRHSLILYILLESVIAPAQAFAGGLPTQPHAAANICRKEFVEECTAVCLLCHALPAELSGSERLAGDSAICGQCHEDRIYDGTRGDYLLKTREGNHPSNIPYLEGDTDFTAAPAGVRIYCNENRTSCTVQCSTCHDPHENVVSLLRVNNQESRLCFSCHRK